MQKSDFGQKCHLREYCSQLTICTAFGNWPNLDWPWKSRLVEYKK